MNRQHRIESAQVSHSSLTDTVVRLARDASIEINVQDSKHLATSRQFLPPGKKIYISHVPGQTWDETESVCRAVHQEGFDPVPHVPVRLLDQAATLDRTLAGFVRRGQVHEVLLIAGDYPQALGPYSTVSDVLRSGTLEKHGLKKISIAGHPEGHPKVAIQEVGRAVREKLTLAASADLEVNVVTQFFFEHPPFLTWVNQLRSSGIRARVTGGLAGPAGLARLFRFAMRCGAGPSMRALGTRPASLMRLVGDHGPERVLRGLAQALSDGETDFNGIHLFCFGGYLRTCEWLHRVAQGHFQVNDNDGLTVLS